MATRNTDTYLRVLGYFQTHLCASPKEAAASLGISLPTVHRYVRLIRADWNDPEPQILDPVSIEMRVRNLERTLSLLMEMERAGSN